MFRIGDFARLSRVSAKMLRHYDALGLLRPARVDPVTEYRYYSADQLPRLNRIVALKDLGFTLAQIAHLLDGAVSVEQMRGMLRLRRAELEQQVALAEARLAEVEARLSQLEQAGRPPAYEVVLKPVEPQLVASIRTLLPPDMDLQPLFQALEAHVAHHQARADRPPFTLYHEAAEDDATDLEVAVPIRRRIAGEGGRRSTVHGPRSTVHGPRSTTGRSAWPSYRGWT